MNTFIEIHDHNTVEQGKYKIWYHDKNGNTCTRLLSESLTNSLLNMKQKENFFMGVYRFEINKYDFEHIVLNGEVPQGFK